MWSLLTDVVNLATFQPNQFKGHVATGGSADLRYRRHNCSVLHYDIEHDSPCRWAAVYRIHTGVGFASVTSVVDQCTRGCPASANHLLSCG